MYTVDEIIDDYIILENKTTKEKKYIKKELINKNVKEQDIIDIVDNKYVINNNLTKKEKERLKNKFNNLLE